MKNLAPLLASSPTGAQAIIDCVQQKITEWVDGADPFDDITMLALYRK